MKNLPLQMEEYLEYKENSLGRLRLINLESEVSIPSNLFFPYGFP